MANSYYSIIEPIIFTASRMEVTANRYIFGPIGMNIPSVKIMGLLCRKKIMTPKEIMELIGGTNEGKRMVVVDTISAGIGDRVLVTTGSSARRMLGDDNIPVDAVVVGIIDNDCHFK